MEVNIDIRITETDGEIGVSAMIPESANGTVAYALGEAMVHFAKEQLDRLTDQDQPIVITKAH